MWPTGAQCGAIAAKVVTFNAQASNMGASSNLGSSTSHSAPCLQPEKEVKDGPKPWDPETWETQKNFLAPGLEWAQLGRLKSLRGEGQWNVGWKIFSPVTPLSSITLIIALETQLE